MPITGLISAIVAVTILLPAAPAFLLFKAIPSSGNVTGRLQGLEFKLGGAFAGYFIVVVLILSQLSNVKKIVLESDQVWTVEGRIVDEKGRGIEPLESTDVQLEPAQLAPERDGYFHVRFATSQMSAGNGFVFPKLYLSHKGYGLRSVMLDPPEKNASNHDQKSRDQDLQHIKLNDISLTTLPPYVPQGAAPNEIHPTYPSPSNSTRGDSQQHP